MKKVININFQGRITPIEESAYDILQQYIDSLKRFFAAEEGKEEIINDIESRIAELFSEILKKGSTCITADDVNSIIKSMGRPEEFEGEEANVQTQLGADQKQEQQSSQANQQQAYNYQQRRLYRDENNKVLGGICSGIANYFGIEPLIIRILAVVAFGVVFIPYLILWVAVPSTASQIIGSTRKRLFRDSDNKVIGGVASGLSHYFGVNVWIPRVIFLIPFLSFVTRWRHWDFFDFPDFVNLSFSPGATVIYIILWVILPEAITSADKLEMKGEPVDLNSIKQTIQNDMEGFKGRAEKFGADIKTKAESFSKDINQNFTANAGNYSSSAGNFARRTSTGLGSVIALIAKIFAYFILGVVLFSIVVSLFALGVACIGLMPATSFILKDGWQMFFAWTTLLFFIWLPVVSIIVWIIRRLTGSKRNSSVLRYTSSALWTLGLVCFILLIASESKEFKYKNNAIEDVLALSNPKIDKLNITLGGYGKYNNNSFKLEPFENLDTDSIYVPNARVKIVKSKTDSFVVTITKFSNGSSKMEATRLANKIEYTIAQKDSVLALYKGLRINNVDKFRNQRIIITVAVPVGKRIYIDGDIAWKNGIHIGWNKNNRYNDEGRVFNDIFSNEEDSWEAEVEYIMTTNGLERTHAKQKISNDSNTEDALKDLQEEMKEKQREIDEKKRELEQEIKEQQGEIEKKKNELKKVTDTTINKYKNTKIAKTPKIQLAEISSLPFRLQIQTNIG